MKHCLLMACAVLMLAAQAAADPVLTNLRPTTCVPDYARRDSARIGTLNPALFDAANLEAPTEDGDIAAKVLNATRTEWAGTTANGLGTAVFTRRDEVVTGSVNAYGRTWELMPACGEYVLYEMDPAAFPDEPEDDAPPSPGAPPSPDVAAPQVRGPTVHDVLVFYTVAAETQWTLPVLKSKIDTGFKNTNTWLTQSGSDQSFRIVATLPSPVQESGVSMGQTWNNLRESPEAKSTRAQYYADEVVLISNDAGSYTGYGGLWYTWSGSQITTVEAWAVVKSAKLGDRTLPHELGHTNGLDHNRENTSDKNAGYHYGYRVCALDGTGFRDIMSYACSNGAKAPLISYFSNPALVVNGQPIGIKYSVDPAHASENVRALNENGPKFAAFRNPPGGQPIPDPTPTPPPAPPVPAAPQNLIARVDGSAVVLTWGYGDNQATAAEIRRAERNPKNGKWGGYVLKATVPAPSATLTDTPPKSGDWRYTVTATNASGASDAAGPQAITVP